MTDAPDSPGPDREAPLAGRLIVVTRARHQSRALAEPLEALGARVLAFPTIATVEPDDWGPADEAIAHLSDYDWTVLTSANAVHAFLGRLAHAGLGTAALDSVRLAVVGRATATALAEKGIVPDLVPDEFRAEGLIDSFDSLGVGGGSKVLVPRALEAREILPDALRERGATVDVVPVYRTVFGQGDPAVIERLRAREIDAVTFTSPSTFRNFRALVGQAGLDADASLREVAIASIGPVTTAAITAAGHRVSVEPAEYTVEGLVEALVVSFTGA